MHYRAVVCAKTAHIEPGSPSESGYVESFNARLRDELLDGEIFYSRREARLLFKRWRRHYISTRPHSALGCQQPASETTIPMDHTPRMHKFSNRTTREAQTSSVPMDQRPTIFY